MINKNNIANRNKIIRRVILIEGLANLIILVTKIIVGLKTNSLAIIGDSIHSLADALNNVIALIVISISNSPPDYKHPYNHQKFETLAVFALASLLVLIAFELVVNSFKRTDTKIISEPWGIAVMIGVLVVNIIVATWERYQANKLNSPILLADASHTFGDVLATIVVIIGWQLSAMGYVWLDKVTALGIAGLVFYLAYTLFKRTVPILVDQIAIEPERLIKVIKKAKGVKDVSRVRSRWIGSEKAVDVIVLVDPDLSTKESHAIADRIELLLAKELGVKDISIHIEPYLKHNNTNP